MQNMSNQTDTQKNIENVCDEIKYLLLSKNKKYGDSALNPVRLFSKINATEQLLVRIDDKLSRISRGAGLVASDEDVINDLIGYLVLLKISLTANNKPNDSISNWDGSDITQFDNVSKARDNIVSIEKDDVKDIRTIYTSGDRFA
jgi:hypothetical protein